MLARIMTATGTMVDLAQRPLRNHCIPCGKLSSIKKPV